MRGLLYIVILCVISGCTSGLSTDRRLSDAESMMLTDPRQALESLNAIDISEFTDSADMAHWALLYSEALEGAGIKLTSDSIINIAVDYYSGRDETELYDRAAVVRRLILDNVTAGADSADALANARYLQKMREYTLYRERKNRQITVLIMASMLLLAFATVIYLRLKMREMNIRLDATMRDALSLSDIATRNEEKDRLVKKLLNEKFRLIDRLCNTYYEAHGTAVERSAIVRDVTDEIEALGNDDATFRSLEQIVNDCHSGILDELKNSEVKLSDAEYRLLVYLSCGFSNRSVSILSDERIETVYKRKSRLKQKLSTVSESLKDRVLAAIS